MDFLINLFYAIAANLYLGSSDGSSGGEIGRAHV